MRIVIYQPILAVGILFLAAGCGKKTDEATSSSQSSPAPTASPVEPKESIPAVQSPFSRPTAPPIVQPVNVPSDATAALGVLTQAVRKFSAERQRVPKNLNEVIQAGYIGNMPNPPAEKKFVLDPKRLEVTLANK